MLIVAPGQCTDTQQGFRAKADWHHEHNTVISVRSGEAYNGLLKTAIYYFPATFIPAQMPIHVLIPHKINQTLKLHKDLTRLSSFKTRTAASFPKYSKTMLHMLTCGILNGFFQQEGHPAETVQRANKRSTCLMCRSKMQVMPTHRPGR